MPDRTPRVLGKMLPQYIGKNVIVAGNLTKVSSNGDSVELTTFDNIKVNVTLQSEVNAPLEVNAEGIIEVWGTVKSKGTIEAKHYVHFDAEHSKDFDGKSYNELIMIRHAISDRKCTSNR